MRCPISLYQSYFDFPENLAFALALRKHPRTNIPLRVGILDLDIFGPSVPTLMGLQNAGEPELTSSMYCIYGVHEPHLNIL